MKDSVVQNRRNYRRRPSKAGDDFNEGDNNDLNDAKAGDGGADCPKLKQQPSSSGTETNGLIGAVADVVDENAAGASLEEKSRCVSSGASAVASSSSSRNTDDGGGQNGARIASGIGFHMLKAMGWTENSGLGQSGKGIVDPFLPTSKAGNLGIGFSATSVYDTQQEAIRQVQKAKREERDRKLKLKRSGSWSGKERAGSHCSHGVYSDELSH